MKSSPKRLFIKNLPENLSETDIETAFSKYGTVAKVEVKTRKTVRDGQTPHFAYIQLNLNDGNPYKCISDISNKKWKGHFVEVEEAKESFMERLKREREEAQETAKPVPAARPVSNEYSSTSTSKWSATKSKVYHSSSSSDEDESPVKTEDVAKVQYNQPKLPNGRLVNGWNSLKETNDHSGASAKAINDSTKEGKAVEADKKRLQSLQQMRRGYQQQKMVLKNALSNIDSTRKNKIIFDDDLEAKPLSKKPKLDASSNKKSNQKRLPLFEDDNNEEEEEINFEVKDYLQGKRGQNLMQLQSRFKNDKRFTMNKKFLEDESESEIEPKDDTHPDNEKQRQFEILEEVLGTRFAPKSNKKSKTAKTMLRFDPSQPDHAKYEIKELSPKEKPRKKVTEKEPVEEPPKPEVSKEVFYKVADTLKDALKEKETFSLASMFSKELEHKGSEEGVATEATPTKKQMLSHDENPFQYDSSTDEEEPPQEEDTVKVQKERTKPVKLWTESFFFKHDDHRLQEGLDFIQRLGKDDSGDFVTVRRDLKQAVKAKVKNNQKKNAPFRRKLGGKKRLRIKRALKR